MANSNNYLIGEKLVSKDDVIIKMKSQDLNEKNKFEILLGYCNKFIKEGIEIEAATPQVAVEKLIEHVRSYAKEDKVKKELLECCNALSNTLQKQKTPMKKSTNKTGRERGTVYASDIENILKDNANQLGKTTPASVIVPPKFVPIAPLAKQPVKTTNVFETAIKQTGKNREQQRQEAEAQAKTKAQAEAKKPAENPKTTLLPTDQPLYDMDITNEGKQQVKAAKAEKAVNNTKVSSGGMFMAVKQAFAKRRAKKAQSRESLDYTPNNISQKRK